MNFKRIVEFGTQRGVLSHYFLLFAKERKAEFYTYDIAPNDVEGFQRLDIFENERVIGNIIGKEGKTILFCDNGDKPKEVKIFSKYLKPGDVVAVHDWGTEIFPKDIPLELKLIKEGEITAFFQKK